MTFSIQFFQSLLYIHNEKSKTTCYLTDHFTCHRYKEGSNHFKETTHSFPIEGLKDISKNSREVRSHSMSTSLSMDRDGFYDGNGTNYNTNYKTNFYPNNYSNNSNYNTSDDANVPQLFEPMKGERIPLQRLPIDAHILENKLKHGTIITGIPAIYGCIKLLSGIYICISVETLVQSHLLSSYTIRINSRLVWLCIFQPESSHSILESKYLTLLEGATNQYGHLYHMETDSHGKMIWDITQSAQKQLRSSEQSSGDWNEEYFNQRDNQQSFQTLQSSQTTRFSLSEQPFQSNEEFFWNRYASSCFLDAQLYEFVTPMIMGFVSECVYRVPNTKDEFKMWLISRLSRFRAGTRYHVRGIDEEGNVANFVETEQIVLYRNEISSFLQIRGSIPLFWDQIPDLSYNPKIRIIPKNSNVFYQAHMQKQIQNYGDVVCVSLVSLKGSELLLAKEFEKMHKNHNHPSVKYIAWDFHKECPGMRYSNIKKLIKLINEDIDRFGYFRYDKSNKQVTQIQTGIIRSNCKDCLDRTNVVMSVIAKLILKKILISHKIIVPRQSMSISHVAPALSQMFKRLWADNGDSLSLMYAGTGALKSDFTRTGKRTIFGLLQDLQNSITRYYINNFRDGKKQDAITLLLGKYDIVQPQNPFEREKTTSYILIILLICFFLGIILFVGNLLLFIFSSNDSRRRFIDGLLWILLSVFAYLILRKNGRDAANQPLLSISSIIYSSEESKKTE